MSTALPDAARGLAPAAAGSSHLTAGLPTDLPAGPATGHRPPAAQAARSRRHWLALPLVLPWALALGACSPQQFALRRLADGLAADEGAPDDEDDLQLVRDAAPAWLKTSEAVLARTPDHLPLATSVAAGFTRYAWAFVAFEADRIEPRDVRAATALRERAARLYHRAQRHALKALTLHDAQLLADLRRSTAGAGGGSLRRDELPDEQVACAYWGAAAWGARIALTQQDPDVVADLPLAIELARRAWRRQPAFGGGDLAVLMGQFEAARPGGQAAQAERHFAEALRIGGGHHPGAQLAIAEALALPAGDRPRFDAALQAVLADTDGRPGLTARALRERALWLRERADDLF